MARKTTWVLVADAREARLFEQQRPGAALSLIRELEAGPPSGFADRPGRVHERVGAVRHGMQPGMSESDHDAENFAREVASAIEAGRHQHEFQELVLVAAPGFLGRLRDHLSAASLDCVRGELAKDLVKHPLRALPGHLDQILHFAASA